MFDIFIFYYVIIGVDIVKVKWKFNVTYNMRTYNMFSLHVI